jgi:hypothetical protein
MILHQLVHGTRDANRRRWVAILALLDAQPRHQALPVRLDHLTNILARRVQTRRFQTSMAGEEDL